MTEEMELPEYIKSVEIMIHRPLPSLIAVSLHAVLDNVATEALIRTQSSRYLPEVRFWPMIPLSIRFATASNTVDAVEVRALTAHLRRIRSEIEECFAPFLAGHFSRRAGEDGRLPAIEIYRLKGTGAEPDSFQAWMLKARLWSISMAFEFHPWTAFRNRELVLTLNHSIRTPDPVPYKLLVLEDEKADNPSLMREDFLTGLLPVLAIRDFVNTIAVDVGQARRNVYRALSRRLLLPGLRKDFALSRRLSREIMMLERVNAELEDGKRFLRASSLKDLINDPAGPVEQQNLLDALLDRLDVQMKTVKNHVEVMGKSFSEHLLVRNMALMYFLQWTILMLTIGSLLVASVAIAANWQQVENLWHQNDLKVMP